MKPTKKLKRFNKSGYDFSKKTLS